MLSVKFIKRHFRLDHPELGQMPRRVRVLRPKRRPKGVNLSQPAGVSLAVQLPADGEIRRPLEKILRVIDRRIFLGQLVQIERGDLEHRPGPFAIAGRDDRRVQVEKAVLLKKLVDRPAHAISHPGNRAESIGPRPQMGDRAQKLERMPFFLQRIAFRVGPAVHDDPARRHFGCLPFALRRLHFAFNRHAATGGQMLDLAFVIRAAFRRRRSGCCPGTSRRSAPGNEKPPLLSRRVRIHPCSRTCRPIASAFRAAATLMVSIAPP